MQEFPWHPALVHLPLGLCFALPFFALVAWASERRNGVPISWRLVLFAQLLVVVGAYLSLRSGDWAEPKALGYVRGAIIAAHAEQGRELLVAAILTLVLGRAVLICTSGRPKFAARALFFAALLVSAALAARTGHGGGELVYRYGAASGYVGAR